MALIKRLFQFKPAPILTRFYNKIVITDDGSTIIALHRDQQFPYEYTRPLPVEEDKFKDSVLKMNDINEVKRVFKNMTPEMAVQQLSSITMTTKHRWFERARDKKAKKGTMNRPYL